MIDLCKLFEVEEGEEFGLKGKNKAKCRFRICDNEFQYYSDTLEQWLHSIISLNSATEFEISKLPKKKEFTDDELSILRNIDAKYKWLARDEYREILYVYKEKPEKTEDRNWHGEGWCRIGIYNHLFKCIQWRDEEPVFIDDYVERGAENE
jgi:hypothetical protein